MTFAAEAGQLQLNAFEPIIAHSLFKSVTHLTQACLTLEERCVRGIAANRAAMRASVERSIGIVTALNPYLGYANATAVAQEAHASGRSVREVVLERCLLSKEQLALLPHPDVLTRPQPIAIPIPAGADIAASGTMDVVEDIRFRLHDDPVGESDHAEGHS